MAINMVKGLKVLGLIVLGFALGVIVSSKFNLKLAGLSSQASLQGPSCSVPPVLNPPSGTHWGCRCTVWTCNWYPVANPDDGGLQ